MGALGAAAVLALAALVYRTEAARLLRVDVSPGGLVSLLGRAGAWGHRPKIHQGSTWGLSHVSLCQKGGSGCQFLPVGPGVGRTPPQGGRQPWRRQSWRTGDSVGHSSTQHDFRMGPGMGGGWVQWTRESHTHL